MEGAWPLVYNKTKPYEIEYYKSMINLKNNIQ